MSRIVPLETPFEPEVTALLAPMMPEGVPPIALFRTFAHNRALTGAMRSWGAYELSRQLSLTLRDREIVIDRTTERCGCEYEWGVHVAYFAQRAGLDGPQLTSLVHGGAGDPCWSAPRDRLLIRAVDALHDESDIGQELWGLLEEEFEHAQLLDLTMLCGWYHAISFTATAARVPLEVAAPTFDSVR
jgi:alkylhydroperoxidase family enzyme